MQIFCNDKLLYFILENILSILSFYRKYHDIYLTPMLEKVFCGNPLRFVLQLLKVQECNDNHTINLDTVHCNCNITSSKETS